MLAQLKSFLQNNLSPDDSADSVKGSREHRLALATSALMLQISAIDHNEDPRETETILDAAGRLTRFSPEERQELLTLARDRVADATSLYEFTEVINELCHHDERMDIIEQLWRVALADEHVDRFEEHLIRRVADLFHLSPSEFVQCRHRARARE